MKILFIGDIFGNTGKRALAQRLPDILKEHSIDLCIANAENLAGGKGMTHNLLKKIHKFGISVVTGGNHSFANSDCDEDLESDPFLVRPLNFPPGNKGKGSCIFTFPDGRKIGVINLMGRTFFHEQLDCPFRTGMAAIEEMLKITRCIIIDFHAEATSEKKAFACFMDGKVSAVLGTHTHVQTADETILPSGTAFITDVGMTGPGESVIGIKKEQVMKRFLLQSFVRFEPADAQPILNAVIVVIDDSTGKAIAITRVLERITFV